MIAYTGNPKINAGLNIYFGTNIAHTDPLGLLSARALRNFAARDGVILKDKPFLLKGAAADTSNLGQSQAVQTIREWFPGTLQDSITLYENAIADANDDSYPYMAILLGHEGVHAAQHSTELESEVDAWTLSVKLFQELSISPVTVDGVVCQINNPHRFIKYVEATPYLQRDSMIDFVIWSSDLYKEKVTAPWVLRSYGKWGGIEAREARTVTLYLDRLGKAGAQNASHIMQILEDYLPKCPIAQRQALVKNAGSGLQRVLMAMRAGYYVRMNSLERLTGVKL